MGAWDYGALDNDPAVDVVQRWQEWVEDPGGVGYEAAIDRFFQYWGDAIRYGDPITNMEIIALLAIHLNAGISIPKRLIKSAEDAINRELVTEELASWGNPELRKKTLMGLLTEIGGKLKPPKQPRVFRGPAIHFKNTAQARSELLKLARKVVPRGYVGLSEAMFGGSGEMPEFLTTLHRFMNHRIWEKDWKIVEQASLERQMMLAWYVGVTRGESVEEIAQMLGECRLWKAKPLTDSKNKE